MVEAVEVTTQTQTVVEARPARPDNWRTLLVVGLALTAMLVGAAFWAFGREWGVFWLVVGLVEAWTLVNRYAEDTISEAIWILSQRPIVVLLFCLPLGIAIGQGYLGDPQTVVRALAIGILYGHFFFSRETKRFTTSLSEPTRVDVSEAPEVRG